MWSALALRGRRGGHRLLHPQRTNRGPGARVAGRAATAAHLQHPPAQRPLRWQRRAAGGLARRHHPHPARPDGAGGAVGRQRPELHPTGQDCPAFAPMRPCSRAPRCPWRGWPGRYTQRPGTTRIRWCCLSRQRHPDLCRRPVGERLRRGVPGNRGHSRFRRSGRHAGRDRWRLAPRTVIPATGRCLPMHPAPWPRRASAWKALCAARQTRAVCRQGAAQVQVAGLQHTTVPALQQWANGTPYFGLLHQAHFADQPKAQWLHSLVADLERSGAAVRQGEALHNA